MRALAPVNVTFRCQQMETNKHALAALSGDICRVSGGEWGLLGLSVHLTRIMLIRPSTSNLIHKAHRMRHGVVDVHSAVVRTTETMAIHSNTVAYDRPRAKGAAVCAPCGKKYVFRPARRRRRFFFGARPRAKNFGFCSGIFRFSLGKLHVHARAPSPISEAAPT